MTDRCDPLAVVVTPAESTEGNQNAGGGTPESILDASKRRGQSASFENYGHFWDEGKPNDDG